MEVLRDDPEVCFELLTLLVIKWFVPKVLLVDQMQWNVVADYTSVYADASVKKKKHYEVLVVMQTDARIYPDAVVVKPFTASVAGAAMFRASRLWDVTRLAPRIRSKHDIVIGVPLKSVFELCLGSRLTKISWICCAGLVIAPIASEHARPCDVSVDWRKVRIWHVAEAINNIQIVPANCQNQVEDLNHWIRFVTDIGYGALDPPNNPFAQSSSQAGFDTTRDSFVQEPFHLSLHTFAVPIYEDKAV